MKNHHIDRIIAKVQSLWPDATVKVEKDKLGAVDITLSAMYEPPPLNLQLLMQLAEFMGTKNINDDYRFGHAGCETCDYGSSYGFTLTCRPEVKDG